MSLFGIKTPEIADIDRQSEKLIAEFKQHKTEVYADMRQDHPEYFSPEGRLDDAQIFELWCCQKLASLQLMVIYLENALVSAERRRGDAR